MMPQFSRALAGVLLLFATALAAQTPDPVAWYSSNVHGLVVDGYYLRESRADETLSAVIAAEYPKLQADWPRIAQLVRSWNPQADGASLAKGVSLRLPVLGTAVAGDVVSLEVRGQGLQVGIVQSLSGTLNVQDVNGLRRPLRAGDALWTGDRVSTGASSRGRLRLMDGGQILLRPESTVELQALSFGEGDDSAGTEIIRLLKGGVRVISGLISKNAKSTVKLETQMAVIGVRGTDYSARLCDAAECELSGKAMDQGVYVGLLEGAVGLSNTAGDADLAPGDVFHVRDAQSKPEPAPEAAALVFNEEELALVPKPADAPRPCRLGRACGARIQ